MISDDMIYNYCNFTYFRDQVKVYLGIKLLQEGLLRCRHHRVQVGLEGFKLFGQKHTERKNRKTFHLMQRCNNAGWKMFRHMKKKISSSCFRKNDRTKADITFDFIWIWGPVIYLPINKMVWLVKKCSSTRLLLYKCYVCFPLLMLTWCCTSEWNYLQQLNVFPVIITM